MMDDEPVLEPGLEEPPSEDAEAEAEVDLRQTPEYQRARGSIMLLAYLFFGLLAFMCIVVAVIVVVLLTNS